MSYPAPFDLTGRTALVTGAGSGLGVEFATILAEAGADVACADLNAAAAQESAALVEKLGRKAVAITADVSQEDQVADMVSRAAAELGRLDILINNAGVADANPAPVHQFRTEDWHQVIDIDLHGVFYTARETLKVMVPQGNGKIVNVASMWGITGPSSVFPIPAYAAAKGAVVNLTRELGLEYATAGIQVNALCPGFYRTRLAGGAYDDPGFVEAITAFTPMKRVAEASEIRGPALFLASAASDYMTGQLLVVDGGCTAK